VTVIAICWRIIMLHFKIVSVVICDHLSLERESNDI
jgi:hypothetical protein